MDFNLEDNVLYYGDRNTANIEMVPIKRITNLHDGHIQVVTNATVWSISYDWINRYLYWTDDM